MPTVLIDRKPYVLPDGLSVLDALDACGIHLPALCHDARVTPSGCCRTCLVNVAGRPRASAACTTVIADRMQIETDAPDLARARRGTLEMLARHHPVPGAASTDASPFLQEVRAAGLEAHLGAETPRTSAVDGSHPYVAADMSRCILCQRCVRICDELQGQRVWHLRGRGLDLHLAPDGPTLRQSTCVACGACVDTCPTGALHDARAVDADGPVRATRTVCPYCGVGCQLRATTVGDAIAAVTPVPGSPVSKGHVCVKGRYAFDFVSAPDRITEPLLRVHGRWQPASWQDATSFVATRLRELLQAHGPDQVGVLGSARATNEDNYVTQKFARVGLGTHNVDCCARVCHAPSAAALKTAFGTGLATNAFDDIERAATVLVCGANVTEAHPVVGARIVQAARRGTRLIVIDPRRIELAEVAHRHLAPRPGTNVPLLNALANTIVTEGLCDDEFVRRRVAGFDTFAASLADWTPEVVAPICEVPAEAIRQAARMYAAGPSMALHGLGLTEHVQGTDGVTALINLALLTGNVGRPGAGVNPLRGQNNVQGAAIMGCDPASLPGGAGCEEGRSLVEPVWGAPLPTRPGLTLIEMLRAARRRRFKALWVVGYDVLMTNPDRRRTQQALAALDLLIVQDLFLTDTAREYGTVFLPACSSFEKEGTFMNAERRVQRVRAARRPAGASRPDWQIVCDTARAMGLGGFGFAGVEDIWNEVRRVCPGARGMSYTRLDADGLQWPCPDDDHPGTPVLHAESFAHGRRAELRAVPWHPTPERVTRRYPLLLMTGRSLYQFNAGTMTARTPNLQLRPTDTLDLSSSDAARYEVRDGDVVRVVSRHGATQLPVHVSRQLRPGHAFATFQTPGLRVNALTGPHGDRRVGTPEYKVTAVRLERLPQGEQGAGAS